MIQQTMLELMNHFASVVKSEKSEKKKMEQLSWRAMGEMQQFKGGESEWGRLEGQVPEHCGQREPDDEEVHDVRGGEH